MARVSRSILFAYNKCASLATKWTNILDSFRHKDEKITKADLEDEFLGKIETATNSERLGGNLPGFYATQTEVDEKLDSSFFTKTNIDALGINATQLGGVLANLYAKLNVINDFLASQRIIFNSETLSPSLTISNISLNNRYSSVKMTTAGGDWIFSNGIANGNNNSDFYLKRGDDPNSIRLRINRGNGSFLFYDNLYALGITLDTKGVSSFPFGINASLFTGDGSGLTNLPPLLIKNSLNTLLKTIDLATGELKIDENTLEIDVNGVLKVKGLPEVADTNWLEFAQIDPSFLIHTLKWKYKNGRFLLYGTIEPKSGFNLSLGTIPFAYRPSEAIYFLGVPILQNISGDLLPKIRVNTSGQVNLEINNAPANTIYAFTIDVEANTKD